MDFYKSYFKNMFYQLYLIGAYILILFTFLIITTLVFVISIIFLPLNMLIGQNSTLLETHIENILDAISIKKNKI